MAINLKPHLTQQAHCLIREHFSSLEFIPKQAIDATCGNGLDTLFLAELVSDAVWAFDIQESALNNTQNILHEKKLATKVKLIKSGHENMTNFINKPVDIIMFNFGYLPQADKTITTMTETSLKALTKALDILSDKGILSILCYPGHAEGKRETVAIGEWLKIQSRKFPITEYLSNYPSHNSPVLFTLHQP